MLCLCRILHLYIEGKCIRRRQSARILISYDRRIQVESVRHPGMAILFRFPIIGIPFRLGFNDSYSVITRNILYLRRHLIEYGNSPVPVRLLPQFNHIF